MAGFRFGRELRRRHSLRVVMADAGRLCVPMSQPASVSPSFWTTGIDRG
jgi:hypothetical protein